MTPGTIAVIPCYPLEVQSLLLVYTHHFLSLDRQVGCLTYSNPEWFNMGTVFLVPEEWV